MSLMLSIQDYELSFPQSLDTAQVSLKTRKGWRLCLYQGQKVLGLGEIAPWHGFGAGLALVTQEINYFQQNSNAQARVLAQFQSLLDDQAFMSQLQNTESFDLRLHLLSQRLQEIDSQFKCPEIKFGFEVLALDALARQQNIPLSMLLEPKTTLSASTHHLAKNYSEAITLARQGYKALKIKVGVQAHWVEELMEIARIRATLPDIELRLDANQAWDAELAFGFCIAAQAFDIAWIEEPCHSAQELLLLKAKLKALKACSIGLDESLSQSDSNQLKTLLSLSRVSHCTLKPMFLGGLLRCAQQALELKRQGKSICITHALGSWIERTACAHLVASLQVHDAQVSAGLGGHLSHDISDPLQVFGGEIRIPNQGGLGAVELARLSLDLGPTLAKPLAKNPAKNLAQNVSQAHNSDEHTATSMTSMPHPLRMATLARPQHIVAQTKDEQITYQILSHHVLELSQCLNAKVQPILADQAFHLNQTLHLNCEDPASPELIFSFALPFSIDWLICFHAINAQAWVSAPLNPKLTQQEKLNTLALVGSHFHCQLSQNQKGLELYQVLMHTDQKEPQLSYLETFNIRALNEPSHTDVSTHLSQRLTQFKPWRWTQDLVIICTSGTTGTPQKIPLKVSQLYLSAFGSAIRLGHQLDDVWLACLPPYHVGGLSTILRCLLYQTTVQIVKATADSIYQALPTATLASLTPTLLNDVINLASKKATTASSFDQLRAILVGGGPTSESLWNKAITLNLPLRLTWGMSEAASQLCTQMTVAPPSAPLPPLPFALIETHSSGRLAITGPLVAEGKLLSNDLGTCNEHGVNITGRADDAIISGGINISPQEIEDILNLHPLIKESAVLGQTHSKYGQRPIAFLVSSTSDLPNSETLKQWCRERLSTYKTPDAFHWCSQLPRNELGKLQRRKLKTEPELYLKPTMFTPQWPTPQHNLKLSIPTNLREK